MTKARDLADLISAGNPLADGAISVSEISDLTATAAEINQLDNTADLPDIRPSLLLDFANSKTLDPRITFTRGSTATYWDGKTTAKAEENLFKYSQEFDNVYWAGLRSVRTANQTTAPDGTTTADAITQAAGETNGGFMVSDTSEGYTSGVTYTTSIYAKPNGKNFLRVMTTYANSTQTTWFNLSTGSIGTSSSDHTASMVDAGNGWYRCIITATADSDGYVNFYIAETDGASAVTDDQTGYYAWGAQVEQRSSATAYTATTSSPIVKYQPVLQTAASGEARFDHDPVTGESKGLLIEEARTNLVPHSTDPTATNMTSVRSASTDISAIAPDGTLTARKHTSDATNTGEHYFATTNASITSGSTYTASYYIKDCGVGYAYLKFYNAFPDTTITVDLSDKTVNTLTASTFSAIEVTDVGNDWYRISATQTADATSSTQSILFGYTTSSTSGAFLGDGYKGAFIWGMQMEEGSFPTSYIPTSGSTVTRAADDAKIDNNAQVLNLFNTSATLYAEAYNKPNHYTEMYLISLGIGSVYPRISLYLSRSYAAGGHIRDDSGTYNVNINTGTYVAGGLVKVALSYDGTTADFATQGSGITDTSAALPTRPATYLAIGAPHGGNSAKASTHIKKISLYSQKLSLATLQAMTEA